MDQVYNILLGRNTKWSSYNSKANLGKLVENWSRIFCSKIGFLMFKIENEYKAIITYNNKSTNKGRVILDF